jgi:hypothetical protein
MLKVIFEIFEGLLLLRTHPEEVEPLSTAKK